MKDEIKEILGSMSEYLEEKKKDYEEIVIKNGFPGDSIVYEVYYEDIKTLLDYITNLQEENERLNNIINELEKWMEREREYYFENYYYSDFNAYGSKLNDVLDKLKELKENK